MATVTDTATGTKYEDVYGNTLAYYLGEGSRFEIEYGEGEQRPESAPEVAQASPFGDGEPIVVDDPVDPSGAPSPALDEQPQVEAVEPQHAADEQFDQH